MLDLVIMCCAEYRSLLPGCLASARKWIQDDIASITVITNLPDLELPGVRVLRDQDMWNQVAPCDLPALYAANWTRQQIFKLSLDTICQHPILCVDTEVRWLAPFRAITEPQTWYTCGDLEPNNYTRMIQALLGIKDYCHESFITDCMLFKPEHLQRLRHDIENKHQRHWMLVVDDLFQQPDHALSEYELYAAWCRHQQHEMNIRNIGAERFTLDQIGPDDEYLFLRAKSLTERPYISIAYANTSWRGSDTRWLTFYQQVRGPDWPDAVLEKDFDKLPEWVQRECIELHGYRPH